MQIGVGRRHAITPGLEVLSGSQRGRATDVARSPGHGRAMAGPRRVPAVAASSSRITTPTGTVLSEGRADGVAVTAGAGDGRGPSFRLARPGAGHRVRSVRRRVRACGSGRFPVSCSRLRGPPVEQFPPRLLSTAGQATTLSVHAESPQLRPACRVGAARDQAMIGPRPEEGADFHQLTARHSMQS